MQLVRDYPPAMWRLGVHCPRWQCGHAGTLEHHRLPQDITPGELKARLRCTRCGARGADLVIAWHGGIVPDFRRRTSATPNP